MTIIPHNEPFDLNSFINELQVQWDGIDYQDFMDFFENDSIVHTFVGYSLKGNRISSALGDALMNYEGTDALSKAKSVALIVSYSKSAHHPLKVSELHSIPKANGVGSV